MTDVNADVLADLLSVASRSSPDRLVAVDRAARETFGPDVVNEAHKVWTDRIRAWVEGGDLGDLEGDHGSPATPDHDAISPGADGDTLTLLQAIRATAPAGGSR